MELHEVPVGDPMACRVAQGRIQDVKKGARPGLFWGPAPKIFL